jgi:hypothetical protein
MKNLKNLLELTDQSKIICKNILFPEEKVLKRSKSPIRKNLRKITLDL